MAWDVRLAPPARLRRGEPHLRVPIAEAFLYAGRKNFRIVNASLGIFDDQGNAIRDAVNASPDTLFVVSAGNDGRSVDATPQYPCALPAANVVCVAATDSLGSLADYSNYGSTHVDLAAPGSYVESTWPNLWAMVDAGFETGLDGFTTGGTQNRWGRTSAWHFNGAWSLADSPGTGSGAVAYEPNVDAWAQRGNWDTRGQTSCGMAFMMAMHTEPPPRTDEFYDYLAVEASTGGGAWDAVEWFGGTGQLPVSLDLAPWVNRSELWLRFRFHSDGDNSSVSGNPGFDGFSIDDFALRCASPGGGWEIIDGTSMATPHVAGVAALVLAREPGARAPPRCATR